MYGNSLKYTDPTGHVPDPSCIGKPDCGVDDPPAPPAPPTPVVPGYDSRLVAPGTGQVTLYNYPDYSNIPGVARPEDLSPEQQRNGRLQGSVRINGQNWNYICADAECSTGSWQPNNFGCQYASATQCLNPYTGRGTRGLVSGAVQTDESGQIPFGPDQLIVIHAPGAPPLSPFVVPVIIRAQDGCPACAPLQVDILSEVYIPSLNTERGFSTPVFIWVLTPLRPGYDSIVSGNRR